MERWTDMNIYIDTHIVLWLYAGFVEKFSETAKLCIDQKQLVISPMVLMELEFLFEIKRTSLASDDILDGLRNRGVPLEVCSLPFSKVIQFSKGLSWTRDPFDRLIVGHAMAKNMPLLTKDTSIREHYIHAVW
ncbi:MAG: transposase [Thiotrichales bacterium]|nr:MAG: transposase [Thiotrichales bacterium]